jgi:hypothetical protein
MRKLGSLWIVVPLVVLGACDRAKSRSAALEKTLKRLHSEKASERDAALEAVPQFTFTREVAARILRAAAEDYPVEDGKGSPINEALLRQLWKSQHKELLPILEEVYDSLQSKREAREAALRILTEMQSTEARALLLRLLNRPSSVDAELATLFVPYKPSAALAKDLFPGLLEVAPQLRYASAIYNLVLDFSTDGVFKPSAYPEFNRHASERASALLEGRGKVIEAHAGVLDEMDPAPEPNPVTPELREEFFQLEILLDYLGHLDGAVGKDALRKGLDSKSIRLRAFAALSLLSRKEEVPGSVLEGLARNLSGRSILWDGLTKRKLTDRFPAAFRTPKALAEADLVHWLQYPTELGYAPKEIELLAAVRYVESGKAQLLYVFKFRHPHSEEGKWRVGVSGPFVEGAREPQAGGSTFSKFEALDSKTLKEHIRDYLEPDVKYSILESPEAGK